MSTCPNCLNVDITLVTICLSPPSPPHQLFGLVVTLLDALRTSFSQRSFEARSMGGSDPLAEAAVAATTMLKVPNTTLIDYTYNVTYMLYLVTTYYVHNVADEQVC